jgi:hypothetical protein
LKPSSLALPGELRVVLFCSILTCASTSQSIAWCWATCVLPHACMQHDTVAGSCMRRGCAC